jgi:hypothetical protein
MARLTRCGGFELHGAALGAPRHVPTENLVPKYLYWIGRNQHGDIIAISSGEFEQRYVLATQILANRRRYGAVRALYPGGAGATS